MLKEKKKISPLRLAGMIIARLLLLILAIAAVLIAFLSITEYRPADRTSATINGSADSGLAVGDSFTIMSWNIGYGALGDNADFFMDGGKMVNTASKERVLSNMEGILAEIRTEEPDVIFLQETDINSSRSRRVNELESLKNSLKGYCSFFANNFKVAFLPYPVPPMGKVDSGIATFSSYGVKSAERVQLPIPFSWPVRMANLKRCLLISRVPIEGTDKELVLINLHLEAYDDGEGKIAQTKMLAEILQEEAGKGNYVIAGGDFNQIFSSADTGAYPAQPGKWAAGEIDVSQIPGDWQFIMDEAVPSCRSLDQPYAGADKDAFQYYLIDGFIVSGNVTVNSAENRDLGFVVSDHNPVVMNVTLG